MSVHIFGVDNMNDSPTDTYGIHGVLQVWTQDESAVWFGSGKITAEFNVDTNVITITLPATAYDTFILISAYKLSEV